MISVSSSLTELGALAQRNPEETRTRAAQEFEAMILNEMMKIANKPPFGETPLDGGSAGRMARDQLYAQLALEATKGRGLGLARELDLASQKAEPGGDPS